MAAIVGSISDKSEALNPKKLPVTQKPARHFYRLQHPDNLYSLTESSKHHFKDAKHGHI